MVQFINSTSYFGMMARDQGAQHSGSTAHIASCVATVECFKISRNSEAIPKESVSDWVPYTGVYRKI